MDDDDDDDDDEGIDEWKLNEEEEEEEEEEDSVRRALLVGGIGVSSCSSSLTSITTTSDGVFDTVLASLLVRFRPGVASVLSSGVSPVKSIVGMYTTEEEVDSLSPSIRLESRNRRSRSSSSS